MEKISLSKMLTSILLVFSFLPRLDSLFLKSINLSYQERFSSAESLLTISIDEAGDHPSPYFFLSSLYELMWVDTGRDSFVTKIFTYSDTSIIKAKKWIKIHPEDAWGYFFMGGTYTIRIFYFVLKDEIIGTIPFLGPALRYLSKAEKIDPGIIDLYLGLGGWKYFKGHLPFMSSEKEKALLMIKRASKDAKYVSLYSSLAYTKILLREKYFDEAISVLKSLTDSFPKSRTFNWPLLKAYYGKKDYKNALDVADKLISISRDNEYSNFESHYYKTKILLALMRLESAKLTSEEALKIDAPEDAPDVKDMKKELKRINHSIKEKLGESE